MNEDGYVVGDEVEWRDGEGRRHRGRVSNASDGDALTIHTYNSFGHLSGHVAGATNGLRLVSAVDLLAEKVRPIYHVRDEVGSPLMCGMGDELLGVRDRDHREGGPHSFTEWGTLVLDLTSALDMRDRTRPLNARDLTEAEYERGDRLLLCRACLRALVLERAYPAAAAHLSDEELKDFVRAFLDGRIYTHLAVRDPNLIRSVFMVLALAGRMPKDYADTVGLIWEFLDQAGPRGINGHPMFFSARFMHRDDWDRVRPVIQAELERRDAITIPPREG